MPDDLTLRPTAIAGNRLENDFCVRQAGRPIGRIRLAHERAGFAIAWDWAINPPLPIPPWGVGRADTIEEAKEAFRQAWERFYATLTPHDIAHWHHHQDAAAKRSDRE